MDQILVAALHKLMTAERWTKRHTSKQVAEWCLTHAFRAGVKEGNRMARQGYEPRVERGYLTYHKLP